MVRYAWLLWWVGLAATEVAAQSYFIIGWPRQAPPAVSRDGRLVFSSAITPEGEVAIAANLYVEYALPYANQARKLTSYDNLSSVGITAVSMAPDGTAAAYTAAPAFSPYDEEVHWIDLETGKDRTLVVNTEECDLPIVLGCLSCYFACLHQPHITPDGGKVLFAALRKQPFYVVNTDGSGLTRLPVYSGGLAEAPQRVISRDGLVVFTSQAPSGPTSGASASDVYVINLDGTGLRNLTTFGPDPSVYSYDASISADGKLVVFASNYDVASRGAGNVQRIFAVTTDGTGLRALTGSEQGSGSPSLAADGTRVVYVQGRQIHVMNTSGSGSSVALTSTRQSVAWDPVVSDDGALVTYGIAQENQWPSAVYRVAAGGGASRPVYAPRAIRLGGVESFQGFAQPSPGSLLSVFGVNFGGDSMVTAQRFPLPKTLGDISLLVNGEAIPLLAATPWQLVAQLPQTTPEGGATFQLRGPDGSTSAAVTAEVTAVSPEVFLYDVPVTGQNFGQSQVAAFHAGTRVAADEQNPAQAGETLETYGTGLGRTDPAVLAGEASPLSPPARALVTPTVLIGDKFARITFAGLAPGFAGVYQANVVVPEELPPGLHGLMWTTGEGGAIVGYVAVK